MHKSVDISFSEIELELDSLKSSLRKCIDYQEVSLTAKKPFMALWQVENIKWRLHELASSSCNELKRKNYLGAALLIRSCLETVSLFWYLNLKIEASLEKNEHDEIDEILDRLLLGSKKNPEMPSAINILTCIDKMNKIFLGAKESFENLCELAHPNWAGTSLCFSEFNEETRRVSFGRYTRFPNIDRICLNNLSNSLLIFKISYQKFENKFCAFTKHCEEGLS